MDGFWKATGAVLITVILGLAIGKKEKDFAVLLTMSVCTMTAVIGIHYLKPVLDLLRELSEIIQLQNGILTLLLKVIGIVLVSEIAAMVCMDSGNQSMAKSLQLLGSACIANLSIPLFQSLLNLIQDILQYL